MSHDDLQQYQANLNTPMAGLPGQMPQGYLNGAGQYSTASTSLGNGLVQFPGGPAQPNGASMQPVQSRKKDSTTKKRRRRKKCEGGKRDHVCGCGKAYLSYPALYTHIKTKHGGIPPDGGTQKSKPRGRPKVTQFYLLPAKRNAKRLR